MHEIGRIKLLQVQQSGLKVKQQPYGYYDPTPLLTVKSLLLYPDGVIGVTADGRRVIDVHHVQHPASRNHSGINGVSVAFTSHYEAMRSKFGDHLVDGCAGENILVEADDILRLADLEPPRNRLGHTSLLVWGGRVHIQTCQRELGVVRNSRRPRGARRNGCR